MTNKEILEKVKDIVSEQLGVDYNQTAFSK